MPVAIDLGCVASIDIGAGQSHEFVAADLDDDARRAAQHVVSENARVQQFASAISAGELHAAGEAMNESHRSLSQVYSVSCRELDTIQQLAANTDGIYGAHMTGAGFGGWVVALIDGRHQVQPLDALFDSIKRETGQQPEVKSVVASEGAFC